MARRRKIYFDTPHDLQRVAYRARKSLGRCARCGEPSTPEGNCCAACLVAMATAKHQAQELGMCVDCWTEPALPGKRYCEKHAAYRHAQKRLTYGIRLVRKLCVRCGKTRAVKGKTLCRAHLQQQQQYARNAVLRKQLEND